MNYLAPIALALAINLVMFVPAYLFKTDKLTDITYALSFIGVALYAMLAGPVTYPTLVLFTMILVWAIRLGGYLLVRIKRMKKDARFDEMRKHPLSFLKFWVLQGIAVGVILVPSIMYFIRPFPRITTLSYIGIGIFALGLIIETIADHQKYVFKCNPKNKGKWIEEGIWSLSRHPNYLGEMLVWIGIYVFTIPSLIGYELLVGAISPLFIITLLMFVSGIPLLEKSADKKWGKKKAYKDYKKRVGILLPHIDGALIMAILTAHLAGVIGSIANVDEWYRALNKPAWNPPNWVFGPVWLTLYTLMGISAYLVWREKDSETEIGLYAMHLVFNALWSIIFFGLHWPGVAFIEIIILWLLIVSITWMFYKKNRIAGILFIPYLCWVSFAAVLNFTLWNLN